MNYLILSAKLLSIFIIVFIITAMGFGLMVDYGIIK